MLPEEKKWVLYGMGVLALLLSGIVGVCSFQGKKYEMDLDDRIEVNELFEDIKI